MSVRLPIRIREALGKIEAKWTALDPELAGRFMYGQAQEKYKLGGTPRLLFAWASGATERPQAMQQGQGALALRRVQIMCHLWADSLDEAEDLLMALAAIGTETLGINYFRVVAEDWTTGDASATAKGAVCLATVELGLPLMRLEEKFRTIREVALKQTMEKSS